MTEDRELDRLRLVGKIETARARAREGEARTAEALERAAQRDHDERVALRATANRERRLASLLSPRRALGGIADLGDLIVVDPEPTGRTNTEHTNGDRP